ncbi:Adhesion G-protein coupled receptor D1, partial [Trichoplax sp. H2]
GISQSTAFEIESLSSLTAIQDNRLSSPIAIGDSRLSSNTGIKYGKLSSSTAIKNNKLSPDIAAEDNRLSSSTPVGYDRLSSGTTIKDGRSLSSIALEDYKLLLSTVFKTTWLSASTATKADRLSPDTAINTPPSESQVTILSKYSKTSPSESSSANLFATESLGFSISTHTELAQESNILLTDSTTLLDLKGSFTALLIDFSTSKTDMQDIYQFFTTDNKSTIAKYTATSDVQEKVYTNLYSSGSTFTFDYNKKSLSSRIEPNIYLTTVDDIESASSFSQLYSSCYQPSISHWPTFSSQYTLNSNQNINTNADRLNSVSFKSLAAPTDIDVTTHQIPFHPTPTDQDITFNPFEEYSKVPIVTANDTLRALAKINEELAIHPILTVQTAKIYGQGLNQLISKLITNASNTELIIALSQSMIKTVESVSRTISAQSDKKIELSINYTKILDRFFLRVADNLFLGQSLNITDGETGDTIIKIQKQQLPANIYHNFTAVFNLTSSNQNGIMMHLFNVFYNQSQTINILTGIYPFLRNEITQGAASDDIISDIITCKIDPYPPGESELNFHYSIIKSENIPHQYINGTKSQVLKCVYLNLTTRKWSHSGCTLNPEISKYAMCNCNHLTHFAIMFQFSNLNDVQSLLAPIIIIEYIGIGFSIICIAMTLIVYGILRLKSDRFIIHRNLLVALFLLQCSIIAGSQSVENKNLCTAMAILTHFFCVATFSWMLIEAIHLYFLIITVFTKKNRISIYYFVGWGLPIITVAVTLTAKFEGYVNDTGISNLNKCWLNLQDGFKWAIVGPVISIIVVNTVVMICVVKVTVSSTIADAYKNDSRKGRLQGTKSMVKASAILTPILGLTWLLALIPITKQTIVFTYLSVILNSCQGITIFVFHCVLSSEGITIFVFHCVLSSEVRQKYTLLISRRSAVQSSNKASLFIEDNANLKTDNSVKKGKSLFKLLHFY